MTLDTGGVAEPGELLAEPDDTDSAPRTRLSGNFRKLLGAATGANLADGIGQIAYPWLASAVTRNPLLIALVAIAQQLPWLVLTLPAGVLTDRVERRLLMVGANVARVVLSIAVGFAVLVAGDVLVPPDALDSVTSTHGGLYVVILVATLLFGCAEVIHDNAAQTFLPTIVESTQLERANGRLTSVEIVTNRFAGPPLGSALLAVGYAVPFFVNAGGLALAAVLVTSIIPRLRWRRVGRALDPVGGVAEPAAPGSPPASWQTDLREGFGYLWRHELLRPLALSLGAINLLGNMAMAVWVLFAQDVLGANTTEFALILSIAAVGGIGGGLVAGWVLERLRPGAVLSLVMLTSMLVTIGIGLSSHWLIAALLMCVEFVAVVVWNVLTVSTRQAIIPDRLLGRVNSVYRFFAWGMMPLGTLLGGLIAAVGAGALSHEWSLRLPSMVAGGGYLFVLAYARRHLTTDVIERAKAAARR